MTRVSGPGHKRKDHVIWRAPGGLCSSLGIQKQGLTETVKTVGLKRLGMVPEVMAGWDVSKKNWREKEGREEEGGSWEGW